MKTEDLIKLALSKPVEADNQLSEVVRFIISLKIEAGRHRVRSRAIWEIYKKWTDRKPIDKINFFEEFGMYFIPQIFPRKINCYTLNQNAFHLDSKVREMNNVKGQS